MCCTNFWGLRKADKRSFYCFCFDLRFSEQWQMKLKTAQVDRRRGLPGRFFWQALNILFFESCAQSLFKERSKKNTVHIRKLKFRSSDSVEFTFRIDFLRSWWWWLIEVRMIRKFGKLFYFCCPEGTFYKRWLLLRR